MNTLRDQEIIAILLLLMVSVIAVNPNFGCNLALGIHFVLKLFVFVILFIYGSLLFILLQIFQIIVGEYSPEALEKFVGLILQYSNQLQSWFISTEALERLSECAVRW